MGGLAIAIVIAALAFPQPKAQAPLVASSIPRKDSRPVPRLKAKEQISETNVSASKREDVDDSNALWVSPTTGQPIDMQFVPAGAQAFLVIRPAAILSHAD